EPDAEELQHWLELIVDDLLILFYLGIFAPTESRRDGRRMRVAVVCTCADHPAMCKAAGFADKSHNKAPCTQGDVDSDNLYSDECLKGGCPPRSAEVHVARARAWRSLEDKKDRDDYFKQHGSHWSELMRLPYYDCVAMTVVDPMHNLLLGVVKHQWYSRWIKGGTLRADTKGGTKRELSVLHRFLDTFEAPEWVGRLPLRVGEPAGGSLTADEYKLVITCPGMIILPLIWDQCLEEAVKDYEAACKKY
ncbi:hypothetical protein BD309DRAFT_815173, partial [Dichomitus squalens]